MLCTVATGFQFIKAQNTSIRKAQTFEQKYSLRRELGKNHSKLKSAHPYLPTVSGEIAPNAQEGLNSGL